MNRIVLVLILLFVLATGSAVHSAQPAVPLKVGDTWIYRTTRTAGGVTETGTLTVIYRGKGEYRGSVHHYTDSYSSFTPGAVERDILIWAGRYFRQRATILFENSQQVLEIVFNRPYAFSGVEEEISGATEIYERGYFTGRGLWTIEVLWQGTGKVAVPAGTFTAERWKGRLQIGRVEQDYTVYTVGPIEIRADVDVRRDCEFMHTIRFQLEKGPTYRR